MISPRLKKIVNVYQVQYAGFKAPGFGDFLRGCFSMSQFIRVANLNCGTSIEFDMDICNHPMSAYVMTPKVKPTSNYTTLGDFKINPQIVKDAESEKSMLQEIIQRFNSLQVDSDGIYYGFCCKYEVYPTIEESDKVFIRSRLVPTPSMGAYILSVLKELNLKPKEYSVLHVRCSDGDSFSFNGALGAPGAPGALGAPKPLTADYFKTLDGIVDGVIDTTSDTKYLVLSSHNGVKEHYKSRKGFVSRQGRICHLGLDDTQETDATRDTMLDFYLMSMAKDIIGITPYGVCGFSQECAKLYNIPHTYCKFPFVQGAETFTMAHMTPAQRMSYDLLFRRA